MAKAHSWRIGLSLAHRASTLQCKPSPRRPVLPDPAGANLPGTIMNVEKTHRADARPTRTVLVRRHAVVTRLTHWLNALCLGVLLLSGLQIFNAWPNLYWGQYGADGDPALLNVASTGDGQHLRGYVRAGALTFPT